MNDETQLWHVTVTVGGEPHDLSKTHQALLRLIQERPFIHSLRYAEERAEVRYWEESDDMVDAASLALRLWNEHRNVGRPAELEDPWPRGGRQGDLPAARGSGAAGHGSSHAPAVLSRPRPPRILGGVAVQRPPTR